ncbi:MAG: RNA 2',3'-cyclic phosphodiesterase [Candidatus Diapherotrites archaeon]|nr:RNA 2',3'-cyclic phosphodiesterase [Candidatus Diapherotrites archaeon]
MRKIKFERKKKVEEEKGGRCFIAVEIPESIRRKLFKVGKDLVNAIDGKAKAVELQNIHVTLHFLGEMNALEIRRIRHAMDKMDFAGNFEVRMKGIGFFPSENRVSVIWGGIDKGAKNLETLYNNLAMRAGFNKERFVPHATLARVKYLNNKDKFIEIAKKFENEDFGTFKVKEVILYKSTLTQEGPVYKRLYSTKL